MKTLARHARPRWRSVLPGLATLLITALAATLVGAADLGATRVLGEVGAQVTGSTSPLSGQEAAILWQLRMPRIVLAMLVGAGLAVSGAAFQSVFANPLADPYLLGAGSGAGLTVTMLVTLGPQGLRQHWLVLPVVAFLGAVAGVALTWRLGSSASPASSVPGSPAILVLAGVAVSSFLTAGQTFVQQYNTDKLQEVYAWTLGGLGTAGWREVLISLPYIGVATAGLIAAAPLLDVLALGDEEARALGLRPRRLRAVIVLLASAATAAAVAVSGLIGFVGIVVPHLVRLLTGGSYRILVPLVVLYGAAFLLLADVVARTALAPSELPIGVVTAFTGAPFFVLVLRSARKGA